MEVKLLKALEWVAGLPRVLGYSVKPPAYLMTRHGTHTLHDMDMGTTNEILLIDILVDLTKILEEVHSVGYVHNDLKADQVAVAVGETKVEVTLLDLGNMTPLGYQPYGHHIHLGTNELVKMNYMYPHLAPEAISGMKVTAASDIFSFGKLVEFCNL